MAIPVSQDLDFGSGFQPISALMDNRASDPGSPKPGPFGIRAGLMRYYDGSQVVTVGGGGAATPGVTDELPIQSVQRFKDGVPTPGGLRQTPRTSQWSTSGSPASRSVWRSQARVAPFGPKPCR